MKKIIAVILLCCFTITGLAGCGNEVEAVSEIIWENDVYNAEELYDVIVVGTEPEGVSAAVSAARNGMKTLLLGEDKALGGLMTIGELNFIDMCESRDGTLLTRGFFKEFYEAVDGSAFDIIEARNFFLETATAEKLLTLRTENEFVAPIMDGNTIIGVTMNENGVLQDYYGMRIIDATVDADVAAAAGVPYTYAGEDIGEKDRQMGVTLVFELSGVNWTKVSMHLNWQRFKAEFLKQGNTDMGATKKTAWGYTEEGYAYEPQDEMMRLRGFNIARQNNGNVLINALIIFGVNPLSDESKAEGIARGQAEMEYLIPYIRENFAGFENAALVSTAKQLYVRESRHTVGEYQLTIDDVLENRDQWDKIAIGAYPVDVQPTATQTYGTVIGSPDRYAVPFRCLVPKNIDGMLVVGRSASYTSLAAGSARVIPLGMAEGEAAGVAAAYSINNQMDFRTMSQNKEAVASVQNTLKAQGAYLDDFSVRDEIMDHWAYPGVKVLRSLGILDGGYNNDYKLDEPVSRWRYQNMVNNVLKKSGVEQDYIEVNDNPPNRQIIGTTARAIAQAEGVKYENDYNVYLQALEQRGILTENLQPYFTDSEKQPDVAEVVQLMANMYVYLNQK
ncbi:MAG: FAD-dependent oxidoreductase [Peptococcaceae bacterium]|nr:FAD-dependent oxidoreductase [Peptococcaceae bacterium]